MWLARNVKRIRPITYPGNGAAVLAGVGLVLGLLLIGCGADPPPGDANRDGTGAFSGSIDPDRGTVLLGATTVPGPNGTPLELTLIGCNLRTEPISDNSGHVAVVMDVSIRNAGQYPLYPPAQLTVYRLSGAIEVIGSDWTACPRCTPGFVCSCAYALDYADRLGADGVLTPGEESSARTWRFRMSRAAPFSFEALAHFGLAPGRPRIGGIAFVDSDEDGVHDPTEPPLGGVTLRVTGPGLEDAVIWVTVRGDGRWSFGVREAGLYTILATPPPTFASVHFTTPNPLQVVLTPGPSGVPESYDEANFGIANDLVGIARVIIYPGDPTLIEQDHYMLNQANLNPEGILTLTVGFSGCQADHPLALYLVGGFMESIPVQARLILSHDDRGETCDAFFTRTVSFDLNPILAEYQRVYGRLEPVLLNLTTPDGQTPQFRLEPPQLPPRAARQGAAG